MMKDDPKDAPKKEKRRLLEILRSAKKRIAGRNVSPAAILFVINLVLIYPLMLISLKDLGPFDEMIYIDRGRQLVEGNLPEFARNPFLALLYAATYLPFRASPFWIVHSACAARLILFSLTWLAGYLVARQFSKFASPIIAAGLLVVSPLLTDLFLNPSDALFAGLSGLTFWQVLKYYNTREHRHVWQASALLGLAALSRNDGLVLFPLFLLLTLLITLNNERSMKSSLQAIVAGVLPFALLVAGYVLFYGSVTGNFSLGTAKRTYMAFEQGQPLQTQPEAGNLTIEAQLQARQIFGSPEENGYSIFRAIRRNPSAYFDRLKGIVTSLPSTLLHAYDIRLGVLLFLFALVGVVELLRKKAYLLTAITLLWPAHLAVYFLTFFRSGYLLLPFFITIALAAIGLRRTVASFNSRRYKMLISFALVASCVYGLADHKLAIFLAASVFLFGIWAVWIVLSSRSEIVNRQLFGLLVLMCLGLILRGAYPSPGIRSLGSSSDEQAVLFMIDNLEPGSRVVSFAPGHVLAARMSYVRFPEELRSYDTGEELYQWLVENDIAAIHSINLLRNQEAHIWGLVEEQIGVNLERAFRQDPGDIQVILVH
jgi:hypothetical protein